MILTFTTNYYSFATNYWSLYQSKQAAICPAGGYRQTEVTRFQKQHQIEHETTIYKSNYQVNTPWFSTLCSVLNIYFAIT